MFGLTLEPKDNFAKSYFLSIELQNLTDWIFDKITLENVVLRKPLKLKIIEIEVPTKSRVSISSEIRCRNYFKRPNLSSNLNEF